MLEKYENYILVEYLETILLTRRLRIIIFQKIIIMGIFILARIIFPKNYLAYYEEGHSLVDSFTDFRNYYYFIAN
jgi:hypothetical protein